MDTKPCECGKKMILCYKGYVLDSYPVIDPWQWWCGGCDRVEDAPSVRDRTQGQVDMDRWKAVNIFSG